MGVQVPELSTKAFSYYACVRILLYASPHAATYVFHTAIYVFSYCYICVLYMCQVPELSTQAFSNGNPCDAQASVCVCVCVCIFVLPL